MHRLVDWPRDALLKSYRTFYNHWINKLLCFKIKYIPNWFSGGILSILNIWVNKSYGNSSTLKVKTNVNHNSLG